MVCPAAQSSEGWIWYVEWVWCFEIRLLEQCSDYFNQPKPSDTCVKWSGSRYSYIQNKNIENNFWLTVWMVHPNLFWHQAFWWLLGSPSYFLLPLSHFSRVRLCDPIDGGPSGSPIPRMLKARTLEWVAISFSNAWKWKWSHSVESDS